jgi:hypothetical protein
MCPLEFPVPTMITTTPQTELVTSVRVRASDTLVEIILTGGTKVITRGRRFTLPLPHLTASNYNISTTFTTHWRFQFSV